MVHYRPPMGSLEKEAAWARKKGSVERALFSALIISGTLLIALAAPNTLKLLKYIPKNRSRIFRSVESAASRLARKGLIKFVEHNGRKFIELTRKGEQAASLEKLQKDLQKRSKGRWDKHWRMIIYDIPERRRKIRRRLREMLRACGFYQLQGSVWVLPYDCEDVITLIKADLGVGKDILYTIVEKIEYDKPIRKYFGLT